ncbi:hypothetical protein V2J09_016282 [Rumex salicifolius]
MLPFPITIRHHVRVVPNKTQLRCSDEESYSDMLLLNFRKKSEVLQTMSEYKLRKSVSASYFNWKKMRWDEHLHFLVGLVALAAILSVNAEDPYRYYTWRVTYGTISPLGVPQRGILINGLFPGPTINSTTNENVIINVINELDEPFLITWNGVHQRKSSWQDGVLGTNCPIPSRSNWTYKMQMKDQIGSYSYFPSTLMHRAAGGFGGLNIHRRSVIALPYPEPAGEFTLVVNDWYRSDHKMTAMLQNLQKSLDAGKPLKFPNALLINGRTSGFVLKGKLGKTYLFRVSNVGMSTSINIRIQGHMLKLVEVEGSHTIQQGYDSLDIHVGQSLAFLVTLNAKVRDYNVVASTRFSKHTRIATAILSYDGSKTRASGALPTGPVNDFNWSMNQARSMRMNLTANAARPNPQGTFHYGTIPITRTIILENSAAKINGKLRYCVNRVSYINPNTPLKLADNYNIPGVFNLQTISPTPTRAPPSLGTSVFGISLHDYIEIIFQNAEKTIQSWHLDGSDFWAVGFGSNRWTPAMRKQYNLNDAVSRSTVQVYPNSWTAIFISMDNKGMWNLRSAIWPRRYLGQELYMRVWNNEKSLYTEYVIPPNALKCGKAAHLYWKDHCDNNGPEEKGPKDSGLVSGKEDVPAKPKEGEKMNEDERISAHSVSPATFDELKRALNSCDLSDFPYVGLKYTWDNQRRGKDKVACKLDRVVVNDAWRDAFRSSKCTF